LQVALAGPPELSSRSHRASPVRNPPFAKAWALAVACAADS